MNRKRDTKNGVSIEKCGVRKIFERDFPHTSTPCTPIHPTPCFFLFINGLFES